MTLDKMTLDKPPFVTTLLPITLINVSPQVAFDNVNISGSALTITQQANNIKLVKPSETSAKNSNYVTSNLIDLTNRTTITIRYNASLQVYSGAGAVKLLCISAKTNTDSGALAQTTLCYVAAVNNNTVSFDVSNIKQSCYIAVFVQSDWNNVAQIEIYSLEVK